MKKLINSTSKMNLAQKCLAKANLLEAKRTTKNAKKVMLLEKAKAKKAAKKAKLLEKKAKAKAAKQAKKEAEKAKLEAKRAKLQAKREKDKAKKIAIREAEKARAAKAKERAKKLKLREKAKAEKAKAKAKNAKVKAESSVDSIQYSKNSIKLVKKICAEWAKKLVKLNDEQKNALMEKLVKAGFSFAASDDETLNVCVNVGCTLVNKMKKLPKGGKAVEMKAVAVEDPKENGPDTIEAADIIEAIEAAEVAEVLDPIENAEEQPVEIPVGDTYTDGEVTAPNENEDDGGFDEDDVLDEEQSEDDDKAEFTKDFYADLEAEGDDANL